MNKGAATVAAPASLLRRGPPASADTDRPAQIVAIAIVMQNAHVRQTNRHAIAARTDVGTGQGRQDRPATRANPARAVVVKSYGVAVEARGPGLVLRIVRPAS